MIEKAIRKIRRRLRTYRGRLRGFRGEKVFCIGRNKTGTTSLKTALSDFGYVVGDQRQAERLITHYRDRDWKPIIAYCYTAQAFQDVPFSCPHTYAILDHAFPKSKFVLSVRDSAAAWYRSLVRHQKEILGTDSVPTPAMLKEHPYVWKGWLYDVKVWTGRPEEKFYDEAFLKERYRRYNRNVEEYFAFKDNLLTLNVKDDDAYQRLCAFLGKEPLYEKMPWENRTQ